MCSRASATRPGRLDPHVVGRHEPADRVLGVAQELRGHAPLVGREEVEQASRDLARAAPRAARCGRRADISSSSAAASASESVCSRCSWASNERYSKTCQAISCGSSRNATASSFSGSRSIASAMSGALCSASSALTARSGAPRRDQPLLREPVEDFGGTHRRGLASVVSVRQSLRVPAAQRTADRHSTKATARSSVELVEREPEARHEGAMKASTTGSSSASSDARILPRPARTRGCRPLPPRGT
jgi:hypothetical protein